MRERRPLLRGQRRALTPDTRFVISFGIPSVVRRACNAGNLIYGVYSGTIFAGNGCLVSRLSRYCPADFLRREMICCRSRAIICIKTRFSRGESCMYVYIYTCMYVLWSLTIHTSRRLRQSLQFVVDNVYLMLDLLYPVVLTLLTDVTQRNTL